MCTALKKRLEELLWKDLLKNHIVVTKRLDRLRFKIDNPFIIRHTIITLHKK